MEELGRLINLNYMNETKALALARSPPNSLKLGGYFYHLATTYVDLYLQSISLQVESIFCIVLQAVSKTTNNIRYLHPFISCFL